MMLKNLQHFNDQNPTASHLLPFMTSQNAALAALAYYNNKHQSEENPTNNSSSNPGLPTQQKLLQSPAAAHSTTVAYQRSYLDALRFYKAAYGSN